MWWRIALAAISVAISLAAIAVRFGQLTIQVVTDDGRPPPKPIMVGDLPLGLLILLAVTVVCVIPLALALFRRRP
jgi:hypothetical protein